MIKLQIQPNRATCLITSFAMLLDIPVQKLIEEIGHDGLEIKYPDLPKPRCYKGHHPQEIIDYCLEKDWFVTEIIANPHSGDESDETGYSIFTEETKQHRITRYLEDYSGVLTGLTNSNKRHAVVWDKETCMIYDPNGTIYVPNKEKNFKIESFWIIGE